MGTKHYYFASANTGNGFVSFLDKINIKNGKDFLYVISGGSGCGKSTMMKNIGEYFSKKCGDDVEYFLCSSDPLSVDGIRIVKKNISIVDGTSPHIITPNLVGVDSKIIDVGKFIDASISKRRSEIIKLVEQKKIHYKKVNFLIKKLKEEIKNNYNFCNVCFNKNHINKVAKDLYSKISQKCQIGCSRTLFLNCLNDVKVDLETNNKYKKIVFNADSLEGNLILLRFEKLLKNNNFEYTKILNNIDSNFCSGIIINNIFIKNNNKNNYFYQKNIKKIIILIKKEIKNAKNYHKEIENIYTQYVDFVSIKNLTNEIIKEIKNR